MIREDIVVQPDHQGLPPQTVDTVPQWVYSRFKSFRTMQIFVGVSKHFENFSFMLAGIINSVAEGEKCKFMATA